MEFIFFKLEFFLLSYTRLFYKNTMNLRIYFFRCIEYSPLRGSFRLELLRCFYNYKIFRYFCHFRTVESLLTIDQKPPLNATRRAIYLGKEKIHYYLTWACVIWGINVVKLLFFLPKKKEKKKKKGKLSNYHIGTIERFTVEFSIGMRLLYRNHIDLQFLP